MKRYIFGARNGIYIIDLQQTVRLFNIAYDFIFEVAAKGKDILFVGTKKQASEVIYEEANRAETYYIQNRWLGGMLTNFQTIKHNITRFHFLHSIEKDGTIEEYPKKEQGLMLKERTKLEFAIGGISNMKALPGAIFVIDPKKEINAVREGRKLGIPIVSIVDTNCDPDEVDYIVPGNDDAIRAIRLFTSRIADAFIEGRQQYQEKQQASTDKEDEKVKAPAKGKIEREIISDDSGGPVIEKIKRKTAPVKKETEVEKE
ncbi:MAG: 30S ribosomal protein S2, partial [Desulfobacteraceae bacterium]|nr:30S ribosomal protein S2 [Desulfobacteraceae bacterium]